MVVFVREANSLHKGLLHVHCFLHVYDNAFDQQAQRGRRDAISRLGFAHALSGNGGNNRVTET